MERRKFTPQFKAKVVLELLSGAKTLAQACREHGIRDSLLYKWRREFLEWAPRVFEEVAFPLGQGDRVDPVSPSHLGFGPFPFGLQGLQHHPELERRTVPVAVALHRAPFSAGPLPAFGFSTPSGSSLGAHFTFARKGR